MGTDLDRVLSAGLQARADVGSPIDPQLLLHTAVARGRRLRTRRRVATAALAMAAVAGTAASTMLLPGEHSAAPLGPDPSSSGPSDVNLARLPTAVGQPGAASRPDLVGSDPTVLHFSVDTLAAAARLVSWSSTPGVETADVQRTDFQVAVALARTRQKLPTQYGDRLPSGTVLSAPVATSVQGRDATLRTDPQGRLYSFDWQPINGLWARVEVQTTSQEQALQILHQIRFDQARRCVLPYRLGYLPTGATVPDCAVGLAEDSPGGVRGGSLTLVDGRRRLRIQAMAVAPGEGTAYRPYQVYADPDGRTWTILVKGLFITAITETLKNPFTDPEVRRILGGVRIADQVHNPDTW